MSSTNKETINGCCNVCQGLSSLRCSGCGLVVYCGKEHQVKDWKSHKVVCSLVHRVKIDPGKEIIEDPSASPPKYVVKANIDLVHKLKARKNPLMRLNPLLIIPVLPDSQDLTEYSLHCPIVSQFPANVFCPCLGCYQITAFASAIMDPDRGVCWGKCTKCTWPVHNEVCQSNKNHLDECQFFQERGIKLGDDPKELPDNFMCIGILRAVLMKVKGKPEYASLMNMPVETQGTQSEFVIPSYVADRKAGDEKVKAFIRGKCGFKQADIRDSELDRLILVVKNNMLPSPQAFDYHKAFANFVFHGFQGRALPHSCLPNCYADVNVASLEGAIYTLRNIKAGEKLEINYDGRVEDLRGLTMASRNIYLQNYLGCAPCTCPRCSDPTENGSYFSAIRCTNKSIKCTGYLLPVEPTSWSQEAVWTCTNKPDCQKKMTLLEVEERVALILQKFKTVAPQNLPVFYGMITEFESKILHPNHYRILTGYMLLSYQIINRMNNVAQYLSDDGLKNVVPTSFIYHRAENPRYLDVFEKILRILHLVQPGANRFTVIILFYASLLRLSQMAEEFRLARNTQEMAELVAERNAELLQITLDFNTTTVGYLGNTYGAYHAPDILLKHQFLLRAYCTCFQKALEPLLASPQCPPGINASPFYGIIQRNWNDRIKEDAYPDVPFFYDPS